MRDIRVTRLPVVGIFIFFVGGAVGLAVIALYLPMFNIINPSLGPANMPHAVGERLPTA